MKLPLLEPELKLLKDINNADKPSQTFRFCNSWSRRDSVLRLVSLINRIFKNNKTNHNNNKNKQTNCVHAWQQSQFYHYLRTPCLKSVFLWWPSRLPYWMLIHLDFIKCIGRKTESDMCAQTAFVGLEADLKTLTSKFVTFDLKFCHKTEKLGTKFVILCL